MISHRYKCIFIHIPKCAGTSVERALRRLEGNPDRGHTDHRTVRMIEPVVMLPIMRSSENQRQLVRRLLHNYRYRANTDAVTSVTRRQYLDYFKFTIVRNPWTRAVSAYFNVLRGERHQKKLGVTKEVSLSEFLTRFAGKNLLRSQMEWITDFRGSVPMDFIGRFENLDEDFRIITSTLDCGPIELPGRKESVQRDRPYRIDGQLDGLIESVYREEIEYFGYERPRSWDLGSWPGLSV